MSVPITPFLGWHGHETSVNFGVIVMYDDPDYLAWTNRAFSVTGHVWINCALSLSTSLLPFDTGPMAGAWQMTDDREFDFGPVASILLPWMFHGRLPESRVNLCV